MAHRLSDHALRELERRGIPLDLLDRVLSAPEQKVPVVVTVYRTSKIDKYWSKP